MFLGLTYKVTVWLSIDIHAQVSIVTKAKLDSISVGGNCDCGEPSVPPMLDVIIVVDGSDSFNIKVEFLRI